MKKLNKQQKAKMVYSSIFKGTALEEGEVFKFKHGKTLWRVNWLTSKGHYCTSVQNPSVCRYLYPRDYQRIYLVEKDELLKWILRNQPNRLMMFFKVDRNLLNKIRKIVPPPDL